jgi:hypothetical protein
MRQRRKREVRIRKGFRAEVIESRLRIQEAVEIIDNMVEATCNGDGVTGAQIQTAVTWLRKIGVDIEIVHSDAGKTIA